MTTTIESQCLEAKKTTDSLLQLSTEEKNNILTNMADCLTSQSTIIIAENNKDIENGKANGLSQSLIDRLTLNEERIKDIADSLITIKNLNDPIHTIIDKWTRPNNLTIQKYEFRLGLLVLSMKQDQM